MLSPSLGLAWNPAPPQDYSSPPVPVWRVVCLPGPSHHRTRRRGAWVCHCESLSFSEERRDRWTTSSARRRLLPHFCLPWPHPCGRAGRPGICLLLSPLQQDLWTWDSCLFSHPLPPLEPRLTLRAAPPLLAEVSLPSFHHSGLTNPQPPPSRVPLTADGAGSPTPWIPA